MAQIDPIMINITEATIAKLDVRQGEALAVTYPVLLSTEAKVMIKRQLEALLPVGVKVLIFDLDAELSIIRPEQSRTPWPSVPLTAELLEDAVIARQPCLHTFQGEGRCLVCGAICNTAGEALDPQPSEPGGIAFQGFTPEEKRELIEAWRQADEPAHVVERQAKQ